MFGLKLFLALSFGRVPAMASLFQYQRPKQPIRRLWDLRFSRLCHTKPSSMEPRMAKQHLFYPIRRDVIGFGLGAALVASLPAAAQTAIRVRSAAQEDTTMGTVTTK